MSTSCSISDPRILRDQMHDMRMPPYMRDETATALGLTRRQYEELMVYIAAVAAELEKATPTDADGTGPASPALGPLPAPRAISLNVAQSCNLACSYCYADEGRFGGAARRMPLALARRACVMPSPTAGPLPSCAQRLGGSASLTPRGEPSSRGPCELVPWNG